MIIKPRKRKILRFQKMLELGLNPNKLQLLFILDDSNFEDYIDLLSNFNSDLVQVNIFSILNDYLRSDKFIYHNSDLDNLFEICDCAYRLRDTRCHIYDLKIFDEVSKINSHLPNSIEPKSEEVSILLAHCNTTEKIEVLKESIFTLKRQNQKIILVSHIDVSDDIKGSVDYFIFDKKNDMITPTELGGRGRTWAFAQLDGYHQEFNYDNHALAVLNLMKSGLGLAIANGFRIAHLIHYDCVIYDTELLQSHYQILKKYDIYHYFYEGFEDRLDGNFLSVNISSFLNLISRINTKEQYLSYGYAIFEKFLKAITSNSNLKVKSCVIDSLNYRNIIDKVKMVNLQIVKEYSEEFQTHTYVDLSIHADGSRFIFITSNDINIDAVVINAEYYKIVTNKANLFKVNDSLLVNDIIIDIPFLNERKIINHNSKFANCLYYDSNLLNFYDLTT